MEMKLFKQTKMIEKWLYEIMENSILQMSQIKAETLCSNMEECAP